MSASWTSDELMTVVAARSLAGRRTCFVGIGLPSAAANLARRLHAPELKLIYESGTIGSKPESLPLSIGDGELAETADAVVPVREIFSYWLEAGRIDVGFLGAAQIDRFGNLNTTVIGDYHVPRVRLPGSGGAPEIAAWAKEVLVVLRHDRRSFVSRLDFVTTRGSRVKRVITDLGILEPVADPGILEPATSRELELVAVYPGVDVESVAASTGWPLHVSADVRVVDAPTAEELDVLRQLQPSA